MVDKDMEAAVFSLLELHSFEEILDTLRAYTETQARLANLLQQLEAGQEWQTQLRALNMACAVLQGQDELVSVEIE